MTEPMEANTCFTRAAAMHKLLWDWKGEQTFPHNIVAVFCIEGTRQKKQ